MRRTVVVPPADHRLVPAMRSVLADLRRDAPPTWLLWSRVHDPDRWSTSSTTDPRELVDHPAFRVGA